MGGPTNVTILPHGAMHHHFGSHSADRHAHRQRHEILGEFEDMVGYARLARHCPLHILAAAIRARRPHHRYENITHADVQPRGKAWRRALAAKINAERLGRWKQVGRPAPAPPPPTVKTAPRRR